MNNNILYEIYILYKIHANILLHLLKNIKQCKYIITFIEKY